MVDIIDILICLKTTFKNINPKIASRISEKHKNQIYLISDMTGQCEIKLRFFVNCLVSEE